MMAGVGAAGRRPVAPPRAAALYLAWAPQPVGGAMVETADEANRIVPGAAWLLGVNARRSGGACQVPAELASRPWLVREWREGWEDGVLLPVLRHAGCGG